MISEVYKSAYQQGYDDAKRDFRKQSKIDILDKIIAEIEDTGAYEQEVNGKTEFAKGITFCLSIIDKYKAEREE